jgi:progranulin
MRLNSKTLGLPASILFLIASQATSAQSVENEQSPTQWPWNLPPHVRYWPEDPPHRRRDLEDIEEHLSLGRSPVGVMKMSPDEGEKFYMEYWQFEGPLEQSGLHDAPSQALRGRNELDEAILLANASATVSWRPAFALHTEQDPDSLGSEDLRAHGALEARNFAAALAVLEKRGFTCPTGTSNCSGIGYPNSCCAAGETCFSITDTGLGPVGCCPTESNCGGFITSCNSPNTPCAEPEYSGGGCCIPNYVCAGVGCTYISHNLCGSPANCPGVINSTLVVTTAITQTFTVSGTSVSTQTSTATSTQTSLACSSSFTACPLSLGGGCCPSGRVCSSNSLCGPTSVSTDSTSSTSTAGSTSATASAVPPFRGTSDTSTSTVAVGTSCPIGFYACSAYYGGGCCRTGRDCQTTSCPATSSTTIISSGETIVVPVGAAATVTSPTGSCATGWSSCPPSVGGNCCPNGYQCGTASCSSVAATTTALVQKGSPNAAAENKGNIVYAFVGAFALALCLL